MKLILNPSAEPPAFRGKTVEWSGTDTQINFVKNVTKLGPDWRYRHMKIEYTTNSQGYRCPEFDKVDWERSLVFLGCSHIFGAGQPASETIPNITSRAAKIPAVNLGQGGTSIIYQAINMQKIIDAGICPKAFVVALPSKERSTFFVDDQRVENYGSRNLDGSSKVSKDLRKSTWFYVRSEKNIDEHSLHAERSIENLCRAEGIPLVMISFNPHADGSRAISLWPRDLEDLARDQMHYGLKTNTEAANVILEQLQLQKVI